MEKKAGYLEKTGNHEGAVASLRTAGNSHLKQEQYQRAIDSFRYLLSMVPDDEEATYNIGAASLSLYEQTQEKNFLEDALVSFDSVLSRNPENITYLIQKGRCLLDMGRFDEGLLNLDRALWINPSDGITLMNKGIALYQLSRHEEALRYFDLVITHHPEHSAPWLMKSRIHLEAKELDTALSEIDQAIKLSPDDSRCWEQKAVILRALGREEEARIAEEKIQDEF
jgi:tetratricopeptide (TPR) repeat protein